MPPMASDAPSQKPAEPILYSFPSSDDLSTALGDFVIKVRLTCVSLLRGVMDWPANENLSNQ